MPRPKPGGPRIAAPALADMAVAVAAMDIAALPAAVVAKAKLCLIDALAGCFALPGDRRIAAALAVTPSASGSRACSIVGRQQPAAPADAAFVNAVATAAAETNDTHPTAVHPGMVVVPAVLAMAEAADRGGAAVIEGIVAGYETMGRLARAAITPEVVKIHRSTGLVGPTGAAFGAARVLGLPAQAAANAASLATHTASGFNEWANAGTDEHVFHAGFAARNGVTAAQLAAAGVVSAPSVLDGRSGLLAAFGGLERAVLLTQGLGRDFEMLDVVHKPAPACFFVQAPAQVAAKIAARLAGPAGLDPAAIDSVEISVTRAAAEFPGCDNPGPMRSRQDASMSIQFSVAAVLSTGRIAHANWERFDDRAVNALAARIRVVPGQRAGAGAPGESAATIKVRLRSGQALEDAAPGFRSMDEQEVVGRFLDLAGPVLGAARAEAAVRLIGRLEEVARIGELTRLVVGA